MIRGEEEESHLPAEVVDPARVVLPVPGAGAAVPEAGGAAVKPSQLDARLSLCCKVAVTYDLRRVERAE